MLTTRRSYSSSDLIGEVTQDKVAKRSGERRPRSASCDERDTTLSLKEARDGLNVGARPKDAPSRKEMAALASQMQQQLTIKTRRHQLWRHKACFRGQEAVTWLLHHGGCSTREAAIQKGQAMMNAGLFCHVAGHSGFTDQASSLYRFSTAEEPVAPEGVSPSESESSAGDARRWGGADREVIELRSEIQDLCLFMNEQREASSSLHEAMQQLQRSNMQLIARIIQLEQEHAAAVRSVSSSEPGLLRNVAVLGAFAVCCASLRGFHWAVSLAAALVMAAAVAYFARRWEPLPQPSLLSGSRRDHSMARQLHSTVGRGPSAVKAELPSRNSSARQLPSVGSLGELPPVTSAQQDGPALPLEYEAKSPSPALAEGGEDGSGRATHVEWAEPPREQDFVGWPDAPLLIRPRSLPYQHTEGLVDGRLAVNTGRPIRFETDLFTGCAVIWVRGLPSAPPGLFEKRRRRTSITVQGRFRKPLALDDALSGQEFARPAVHLPAARLVDAILARIVRSISPSISAGPMSAPYVLAPVLAIAQEVNVAEPGNEPDPTEEVPEDMTLFDATLVDRRGKPLSSVSRKKVFWSEKRRRSLCFTTEHVWTMTLYQSQVDMSTYELDVALKFDLTRHLNGQPLQFMMKDRSSGTYLFNFEAWHEKLLPAAWRAVEEQAVA